MGEAVGILEVFGLVCAFMAAVTAAVEAARTQALKPLAAFGVIANPHEEIVGLVERSASRFKDSEPSDESYLQEV